MIPSVSKTYRHLNRYRELIGILMNYGFQDIVDQLNLRYYLELGKSTVLKRPAKQIKQLTRAERVRLIIEEMGTTFIKFGQIMSTRPDLIPEEFIPELKKLQEKVPPFPNDEAVLLIEEQLEKPIDELFSQFGPDPVASASIAQVYKAILPDDTCVAVKVQRPDIQKVIEVDTEIMMNFARLAEAHLAGVETLQPVAIVEEFTRVLGNEMNFHIEARNMERFNENFSSDSHVKAPRVFRDYSTRTILTSEFIEGPNISNHEEMIEMGCDLTTIASIGTDSLLKQIFEHGFFHADPHPGNIKVDGPETICFLDLGMMGRLSRSHQEDLAGMLVSVVRRDDDALTRYVLQVAVNADEITEIEPLKRNLSDFIDSYMYLPLDRMDFGAILNDLLDLLIHFGIKLPPEFYLLIKALVTIEGVGRELDPAFVFLDHARPFVERHIRQRYSPQRLMSDLSKTSLEIYRLLRDLPEEIRDLIKFVKRGEIKVNLETHSLEPIMRSWDRDVNRLSFAIVVASLFIGSAIIALADIPPLWHGVSIPGMLGVFLSFLMGIWLLIAIALSGHL
jgi:ubiquinone biosynthesis protein